MDAIVVNDLTKQFGKIKALSKVSFTVAEGEIFGYLGPNGAGKTTTLRIILGLVKATGGNVKLFGSETFRPAARNEIGYLPGELHLYGNMTGQRLLDYFAGYRPQRPPILREQLLNSLEVEPSVLARQVKFLSHGTKQKLGLIIAMQHNPRLLLLDQPTTGLDPIVQIAFRDTLLKCAQQGTTVFFSSHILSEVEAVCCRVAILRAGKLVAVESIKNLRTSMVRRLKIRFRGPAPVDFTELPGITHSEISGNEASYWIRGDVKPILQRMAQLEIDDFVFSESELEDIFLAYYWQREEHRHG